MTNLRTHGKSTIVWILMGLLVLGLGGFGVTSFSSSSGDIGAVGDTEISADDYSRDLQTVMNAYVRQTRTPISMAQAQAMGLPRAVQAQLFTAATLEEEAARLGVSVSDERVAGLIAQSGDFSGPTGRFDMATYQTKLRQEGLTEREFEEKVRNADTGMIIQRAVSNGISEPQAVVDTSVGWLLEQRDFTWQELGADELPNPIAEPDQATLEAWHQANADHFTAPEIRRITYVWLTPDMLSDEVQLDDAALHDIYDQRIDQFQQPERRMVAQLVYPDSQQAEEARARIDSGAASFADLAAERGLTLDDVDLGELSEAELGDAGAAVFALEQPGIVGPVQTDLGPALMSMNAILEPVSVSFEDALPELRGEAAVDRAIRSIENATPALEDLLASGATLEEAADESDLQLGQIDWVAADEPGHGSIASYEAFRQQAAAVTDFDFPQLFLLDDGGVFALRLDEVVPPALRPYDEVADAVEADWRQAETHRQLLALAEERRLQAAAAAPQEQPAAPADETDQTDQTDDAEATADQPALHHLTGLARTDWIEDAPQDVLIAAFGIDQIGETEIVDAENRVFLVTLDAITPVDLTSDQAVDARAAVQARLDQSLQGDVYDYYLRAVQMRAGLTVNQQMINAVNTQVR